MGRAHLAQKDYDKARECYKKALECDPKKDSLIKGKAIFLVLNTSYMTEKHCCGRCFKILNTFPFLFSIKIMFFGVRIYKCLSE